MKDMICRCAECPDLVPLQCETMTEHLHPGEVKPVFSRLVVNEAEIFKMSLI